MNVNMLTDFVYFGELGIPTSGFGSQDIPVNVPFQRDLVDAHRPDFW